MKDLEAKIQRKEEDLINSTHTNNTVIVERDCLVNELHEMVKEQNSGAQIRSRAKWIEEGEKSTKYFFNLERQNISNNTIKRLKKDDGSYTQSATEILDEQYTFYKTLYQKDDISEQDMHDYLQSSNDHQSLNDKDKQLLEGKVMVQECKYAINQMKTNKSPGGDGIPIEFYKVFWEDINTPLVNSLNEGYTKGELSNTQKGV